MSNVLKVLARGGAVGEYEISRSLRFNSADSAYLSRTPASAGNRKTWTWSGWVKRSGFDSLYKNLFSATDGSSGFTGIRFYPASGASSDTLQIFEYNGSTFQYNITTNQVFRDPNAWCHIFVAFDSTDATSTNRIKLYFNGIQVTSFSGSPAYPSLNLDGYINNTNVHTVGSSYTGSPVSAFDIFSGYMAEVHFVDGQALTPSSFGEINAVTGVWSPIEYTGTYGTNGFYLDFSDNTSTTTLGYDAAGSNDWTLNNFSVTAGAGNDSLVDTPTPYGTDTGAGGEVRGNYCTLNPLRQATGSGAALANGNLQFTCISAPTGSQTTFATMGVSSGKWYFEMLVSTTGGTYYPGVGVNTDLALAPTSQSGDTASGYMYLINGQKYTNSTLSAYGASFTANDVIGVALDMDAGTITFYKNGSSQGQAFSGISGTAVPCVVGLSSAAGTLNFGQRPFAYTAPSGFKALVTTNLPDPTVLQGDDYFNTVLYTGTGASQSITGVGFQPDWVWIKERSGAADHALYDAVRGVQQQLESNTTTDETTEANGLTAFGTDGFTVGSLAQVNTSTDTYVAWNWKESTTSKFDIVTYTGNGTARTISHNLGVVPNMIIVKARTTASTDQGWPVYHSANTANPETDYLLLNSTAATADLDTVWNDTAPTSSVFSVGTNALVNANNDTYVAYLFANVAGYSAFGSYTGNGSADGPFVYTGFRPAFVLIKNTSSTGEWVLLDDTRSPFNVVDKELYANASDAEATASRGDFLSNGFKVRTTSASYNTSTNVYVYAAFSSNPFKYSLAR